MKVYTITLLVADPDDPDAVDRDWNEVAKAARLVAHHVTENGLPGVGEGAMRLPASARTRAMITTVELPEELT